MIEKLSDTSQHFSRGLLITSVTGVAIYKQHTGKGFYHLSALLLYCDGEKDVNIWQKITRNLPLSYYV